MLWEVIMARRPPWSPIMTRQASALPVSGLRKRLDRVLGPAGAGPERFGATTASDRQVLADADAARASFLVTGR